MPFPVVKKPECPGRSPILGDTRTQQGFGIRVRSKFECLSKMLCSSIVETMSFGKVGKTSCRMFATLSAQESSLGARFLGEASLPIHIKAFWWIFSRRVLG